MAARLVYCALTFSAARALAPARGGGVGGARAASLGRAEVLRAGGGALAAAALLGPRAAAAADARTVAVAFGPAPDGRPLGAASFSVPGDWVRLSGDAGGGRSLTLYAAPDDADTNAFVLVTPVRGDYTSLGSFGNLETVQDTVMPAADGVSYEVLETKATGGAYRYEYTVQVPDQPKRHLISVFAIEADSIVTFNFQARADAFSPDVAKLAKATANSFKVGKA